MSLTHQAAADLARGTIPAIISPLKIQSVLLSLEDKARQQGLSVFLSHDRPNTGDWVVISHLPLFALKNQFSGYNYVNTPDLSFSDEPMIISAESGLFAITEDLPEDQNHIFIPAAEIPVSADCLSVSFQLQSTCQSTHQFHSGYKYSIEMLAC